MRWRRKAAVSEDGDETVCAESLPRRMAEACHELSQVAPGQERSPLQVLSSKLPKTQSIVRERGSGFTRSTALTSEMGTSETTSGPGYSFESDAIVNCNFRH